MGQHFFLGDRNLMFPLSSLSVALAILAVGQQRERPRSACRCFQWIDGFVSTFCFCGRAWPTVAGRPLATRLSFAFSRLTALFLRFHFLRRGLSGHGPNRTRGPFPYHLAIPCFQRVAGFVPTLSSYLHVSRPHRREWVPSGWLHNPHLAPEQAWASRLG